MLSIQTNFSYPTSVINEQQFYALVRATKWNEYIDQFRLTGDASLKRKLPAFIFQATFDETISKSGKPGRWRKQSATQLTGLVVMDIDHIEDPKAVFEKWTSMDLAKLGILLVYITPSGKGLKIVFKADTKKGNLIDNQHFMAEILDVIVDESCKDASRMSFICKEEDILYMDKELFTYENKEFAEKYNQLYREGHSQATMNGSPLSIANADVISSRILGQAKQQSRAANSTEQGELEVILWKDYDVQLLIDKRYEEKLPCKTDSNRHNESLKLASDLLIMLDGDKRTVQMVLERQSWVQEIINERNENVAQTVESAADRMTEREKKYLNQMPSKAMQKAIKEVTGKEYKELIGLQPSAFSITTDDSETDIERKLWEWGAQIEELFEAYPILKDICKGLKRNQYPAALAVASALMMTLMTRCTYRFYHRPEEKRRLNSSTLIVGDPASGKSFATRLYEILAAPIIKADKAGLEAINRYREEMRSKGANKEKPKKPKVIVRDHPARTSNAQFIQDMVNSVEIIDGEEMQLHMLTFDTELDNTLSVQKGGSWIDKQNLELKAFHNEIDGQAYSNNDSVMQNFKVTWNYIYTGTPLALKKKINEANFGSGQATRLTVVPLPNTHFQMMERERYTKSDDDKSLRYWAEMLDKTKGELNVDKIIDVLYDWTARRMADAEENNSKAEEMLVKRCAYHGVNMSAPFIMIRHWDELHQEGEYWCGEFHTDEVDEKLALLIVNMQFICQQYYFGAMAEKYFDDQLRTDTAMKVRRKKTVDAYNELPEIFNKDNVKHCYHYDKDNDDAARQRISLLIKDKLAEKIKGTKTWRKINQSSI